MKEAEILRDAFETAQAQKFISRMPLLPPDDISSLNVIHLNYTSIACLPPMMHDR